MAIYTSIILCSLLFICVAEYCSGQVTESSEDIFRCASDPVCITNRTCVNIGRCGSPCVNGGTCCNNVCICPNRYTGTYCEYEYFDIQPFRTIHFVTANETGAISIPYFNKSVDPKTSLYFKITGCECNITLLQDGDNRRIEIIMEDKEIDYRANRTDSSRIHVSCRRFRNVSVSIYWKSDGFTLGTVQSINNTLLRKTVITYTPGKPAYRAIFSSAGKVVWTLYEAGSTDAERLTYIKILNQSVRLCPIYPQYKEIPLYVSFLNRSSRCSKKMEVKTACDAQNIVIKYKRNGATEKCTDLQETLWIAVCQANDMECNSCKIMRYKLDKISQNAEEIKIVTKDSLLAVDNCFEASKYLIIWHEIRDVFSQDQSSSQRPLPTAEVLTTTFSDSASYTTVKEQSSSTRSLQTTRSLTPTYSEHVSFTSTAGNMLIDDNKPNPKSDNQKVIGLTVGASVSAVIIVILLICLFVVLRRRSLEKKSDKKNQTIQNSGDGNDYTGRHNIALPMQGDLTEYNELAMCRDSHQYGDLKSVGTKQHETTYDYIDPNIHKQETDICKNDEINSTRNPGIELIQEYSVLDPNEKTPNTVNVILNAGRDCDTYAVLDPDESTNHIRSGAVNNHRLDIPVCESNNKHIKESTCSYAKDESYAVLDPNITDLDKTKDEEKNESSETYTVLDPNITGFNRSDLTHGSGNMTKDHVIKNGLIQPFEEGGNDYDFAKPIGGDLSSKIYMPSYRDRTNNGGSYGTYQTGNVHRLQDIHQQNPEENVYNRTVDEVYDSAAHQRMPTSRDDINDHFSVEKINDCGKN